MVELTRVRTVYKLCQLMQRSKLVRAEQRQTVGDPARVLLAVGNMAKLHVQPLHEPGTKYVLVERWQRFDVRSILREFPEDGVDGLSLHSI